MMTAQILGRVTADLELKRSPKNTDYVRFSLAVNERIGDNDKVTFVQCVAFNGIANRLINAKVRKASNIMVTGKLEENRYHRHDGTPDVSMNVIVHDWNYTPTTKRDEENGNTQNAKAANGQAAEAAEITPTDDEIPF